MSRFFIVMLLMSGMPLATAADPEAKPEAVQAHENKLERLSKKLGLTENQTAKLKHLLHANKDKIQALKETDPEQLKSALSPEQKHKLEQLRKNPEALHKLESEVKGKQLKLD
jgi:Spy/CpxP family protein refolding chaperone